MVKRNALFKYASENNVFDQRSLLDFCLIYLNIQTSINMLVFEQLGGKVKQMSLLV